jgi:hypothetical protein
VLWAEQNVLGAAGASSAISSRRVDVAGSVVGSVGATLRSLADSRGVLIQTFEPG